jgi:transposase, IS30 family
MEKYRRLREDEREEISRLLSQGCSIREISKQLNRNVSTISREVHLGSCNRYTYRAVRAHKRAVRNSRKRKEGKFVLKQNHALREYVFKKLRQEWSPVQIAEMLKNDYHSDMTMRISYESIYTYLYVLPRGSLKKELLSCLRQEHKRRHEHKRGTKAKRGIEDMISIEERPAEVADRSIPGHWEGDLIVGKYNKSVLGTLVERTTRTVLLVPLKSRKAEEVAKAFAKAVKRMPKEMKLSLTYDQGREMAKHKLFTKMTGVKVFFAHPGSPWERGTNENTNGLLRQYFPKGTDFNKVTRYKIKKAQNRLNGRPRKVLNWRTPFEVFESLINSSPVALET